MTFDPRHMVFINLAVSVSLLLLVLVFKKMFPKRKTSLLFILLIVSLLPCISLLRSGTYESGALSEHVQTLMDFYSSLKTGIFIPFWSKDVLGGYGLPALSGIYPLPYYLGSFFHSLGFSFLNSIKIVLALSFIGSGFSMFYFLRRYGQTAAFVGSILYLFAPYHLIELHFRVAVGMVLSFAILPLCFAFLDSAMKTRKFVYVALTTFAVFLLIISHPATSIITLPVLLFYGIVLSFSDKEFVKGTFYTAISLALGLFLSAYYLAPVLFELSSFGGVSMLQTNDFKPFLSYIYSPALRGFLFQGHHGETYFLIGYFHILVIILSLILIFMFRFFRKNANLIFFISLAIILFALMQSFSKTFWVLPYFKYVRTPWMLEVIIAFAVSSVGAISIHELQNNSRFLIKRFKFFSGERPNMFIFVFSFLAVFSTILNWGNRKVTPIDYRFLESQRNLIPTDVGQLRLSLPYWIDLNSKWLKSSSYTPVTVISGNVEYKTLTRVTNYHEYILNVNKDSTLCENTLYFPGWELKINGKKADFDYLSKECSGLINFKLKKGLYKVEVLFVDTPLRNMTKVISLLTFSMLGLYLIYYFFSLKKNA